MHRALIDGSPVLLLGVGLSIAACYQREVPEGWRAPCEGGEDCEPGLVCDVYPMDADDSDVVRSCNIPCESKRDCPNERYTGLWECVDRPCNERFLK